MNEMIKKSCINQTFQQALVVFTEKNIWLVYLVKHTV